MNAGLETPFGMHDIIMGLVKFLNQLIMGISRVRVMEIE
jgi:hypothetical protein